MTATRMLELNGFLTPDAPLMETVRRFHALSISKGLTYCFVGGIAAIRNGGRHTTPDLEVLIDRAEWAKLLPLQGEYASEGPDSCIDTTTGVSIDILFAGEGREMPMPDPSKVGEFDEQLGANIIRLHDLVQVKAAAYRTKLREVGEGAASRDRSEVFELIQSNLSEFSKDVMQTYHPAVKRHCMEAFESAARAERRRPTK